MIHLVSLSREATKVCQLAILEERQFDQQSAALGMLANLYASFLSKHRHRDGAEETEKLRVLITAGWFKLVKAELARLDAHDKAKPEAEPEKKTPWIEPWRLEAQQAQERERREDQEARDHYRKFGIWPDGSQWR
jgi:hypothetical protein